MSSHSPARGPVVLGVDRGVIAVFGRAGFIFSYYGAYL